MANNYQAAIDLQKNGWSIYPYAPGTKIPLKDSSGWNDATNDFNQINEWWTEDPARNIGLMLEDHGLMVVDLDRHQENRDGIKNYKKLASMYEPFPPTYTEITPGDGIHFFFRKPEGAIIQQETGAFADIFGRDEKGKSLSGIDIVTKGIPIAPTIVIAGNVGKEYRAIDTASMDHIAPAPEWLVNLLMKKPQEINMQYRPISKTSTAKKLDMIVQGAGEGSRNDHLTKLSGWLLWHGVDNETLAELIYTANAYNSPPLEDKEVNQIIRSMIKKDLRGKAYGVQTQAR